MAVLVCERPPPTFISVVQQTAAPDAPISTYPVKCRGIDLLGVADARGSSEARICVHQLSMELWKRYDTPRATVQKKIERLNIQLQNFTKEQVLTLRREGIVDGYRATAITVDEAEKVCDALEESRTRRGIEKHRLYTKSEDRHFRREEVKINKAHLKRQLRLASCDSDVATRRCAGADEERGAPNRTVAEATGSSLPLENGQAETSKPAFGILLVAEDSYQLPDVSVEGFTVKLAENVAAAADLRRRQQQQQQHSSMDKQQRSQLSVDPAAGGSSIAPSVSESIGSVNLSRQGPELVQGIRSPSAHSSDQDDRASHRSLSTSSSPTQQITPNMSSPERFLFLESEGSECEEGNPGRNTNQNNRSAGPSCSSDQEYRGIPHKGKGLREFVCSSSELEEKGGTAESAHPVHPFSGPKHRRVKATKLRHYAKTTSPSSTTASPAETRPKTQSPLVVSIHLSSLPPAPTSSVVSAVGNSSGKRRSTALSHFATKKRALSRSPSVEGDHDASPTSNEQVDWPCGSDTTTLSKGGGSGKLGKQPKKTTSNKTGKLPINQAAPIDQGPANEGAVADTKRELNLPPSTDARPETAAKSFTEDDEISVGGSTTTAATTSSSGSSAGGPSYRPTATKSSRPSQRGGGKKSHRGAHGSSNNDLLRINTNFSLQSLFGNCPPTLTVRDGELVPERSLSIKDFDQFSLPALHPIHTWSLGQLVPGRWSGSAARAKRPRKMTNQSSKT